MANQENSPQYDPTQTAAEDQPAAPAAPQAAEERSSWTAPTQKQTEGAGTDAAADEGAEARSDSSDPAQPTGATTPADTANDLRAEQYERAKNDPGYAHMMAIRVEDDDKSDVWDAYDPNDPPAPLLGTENLPEVNDDGEAVEEA